MSGRILTNRCNMLTSDRLRELLHYDPATGVFTWRVSQKRGKVRAGDVAGCHSGMGYWQIKANKKIYMAHRLAWFYMTDEWPPDCIDHKDGDGINNCWDNLRLATNSQNQANVGLRAYNTSGRKGVHLDRARNKWKAIIEVSGKAIFLGRFDDIEDAANAYAIAADRYFGEFARVS